MNSVFADKTMYTSHIDLKSICGICFIEVSKSTDLSQTPDESKEIWEKISTCFQITLDSENNLPRVFCKKCVEDLNKAYSFRTKCVTIYKRFQDFCGSFNTIKHTHAELDGARETFDDYRSEINQDINTETEILRIKSEVNFICDICKKVLKSKRSLVKHMVSMHEKRHHAGNVTGFGSARQYHCTTCSYSTPHSQTLINHMRRHNGERPFKCECGKSFTQASSLAAHRKTHNTTTYFTCSECGKQFKHSFSLKTHMLVHNNGTYSCHICNKILKSKRSLTSHLHRHYKIYNYNCEDCGDTFVTSAELLNHRMKHSLMKPIVCHICDYATYSKKNLLVHLKRHEGERAFKCIFCEKCFLTDGNLRRHIRVHSKEKPFTCQTCTQRFAHSSSLNNHMLTFHGVKYKWGDHKLQQSSSKLMKTEKDGP